MSSLHAVVVYWFSLGSSILGNFGNIRRWGLVGRICSLCCMPIQGIPYSYMSKMSSQQILLLLLNVLLLFILCDKISRPKASEGGKGYFNLQLSVTITEGSYRKNSSQKPGGKKWSRDHGGVLLSGLLLWLSQSAFYTAQNYLPRADIAHNEVGPPTSTIINKMHHRLAHKTIWWRHFFSVRYFPSRWL